MRGKKAKALRKLVGYSVTQDRPELPAGGWRSKNNGTCRLPKTAKRRAYQFVKRRYGMLPVASTLNRLRALSG